MTPVDEQLPPDAPGPAESQAEYDQRTGKAAPAAAEQAAPSSVDELRAQLEEAEAAQRDQAGAGNAAAIGKPAGPPAGTAAAATGGTGAQLPDALAQAPAGSMAGEPLAPEERMDVTHSEPVLSQGATGDAVVRLVKLLAAAGYASNTIVHGENAHNVLDRSVMADVERLWHDHPESREPDELYAGREGSVHELQGTWIGPYTWQVLYDLAGAAGTAS